MRTIWISFAFLAMTVATYAQSDVQKLVDTEHSFAKFAADNGTKKAFLEFLADDGLVFLPERANAKTYWNGRGESTGLLSWAPNYADISTNGILGYTTGNWEYRTNGKDGEATAFGEFITIWQRQQSGNYKFVIDIGVGHPRPERFLTEWATSSEKIKDPNEKNTSPADIANGFLQTASENGLQKAYGLFAANDIRMFREGNGPIIGKKSVLKVLKGRKSVVAFAKRSVFFGAANISYNLGTYTVSEGGKVTEKGNSLQIWKLSGGKWQIVLDILKPVP